MKKIIIQAMARESLGRSLVRKVRTKGIVPAVVYGKDFNLTVSLPVETMKVLHSHHFSESSLMTMEVDKGKEKHAFSVLTKAVQYHPLTEKVIHVDFLKISLEKKLKVHVPLEIKSDEIKGVKDGGVFEQVLWDIEVEGLPLDMPEQINVEANHLEIGDSLHAHEIKLPENLKLITPPEETVAIIVSKTEEKEVDETEGIEGQVKEPEVIKEKDKEKSEEKKDAA